MKSKAILRQIAELHPRTSSHEGLDDGCFFCGTWEHARCGTCEPNDYSSVQLHQPDCLWMQARETFGLSPLLCEKGHTDSVVSDRPPVPYALREPPRSDLFGHMLWEREAEIVKQLTRPLFFDAVAEGIVNPALLPIKKGDHAVHPT